MKLTPETAFQIDFNLPQVPAALGLPIPPVAAAAMLAISPDEFTAYCDTVAQEVRAVAQQLLDEEEIAEALARWNPAPGAQLVTIGDSITTYRYGYAELLRALLALARPDDGVQLLNAGQSGYTSTHAREVTFTQFLALDPAWVFIMYGVNDCKIFDGREPRTLVSRREYTENMRAVVVAFLEYTRARPVLLTPTPVIESLTNTLPEFEAVRMAWDNRDIAACAEAIRQLAREFELPCADLYTLFGPEPDPALYLPDGLHPNFAGQQRVLRAVLRAL